MRGAAVLKTGRRFFVNAAKGGEAVTARRAATPYLEGDMKLRLSIRQIRELQAKHGIPNLLQPGPEDTQRMASADFLGDAYYEGSRSWQDAPTREAIEEMTPHELLDALKSFLAGDSPGKD